MAGGARETHLRRELNAISIRAIRAARSWIEPGLWIGCRDLVEQLRGRLMECPDLAVERGCGVDALTAAVQIPMDRRCEALADGDVRQPRELRVLVL